MQELEFSARARIVGDAVIVQYSVKNNSDRDAYLLNLLYKTTPPLLSPDIAYISLDSSRRIVEVTKNLPSLPPGPPPTSPIAPYVTALRAHSAFTEDIHIPLPVRPYQPYHNRPTSQNARVAEYRGIVLKIGFYWGQEGVIEEPSVVFGQPVIIPKGFKSRLEFGILTSEVIPVALPVVEEISG